MNFKTLFLLSFFLIFLSSPILSAFLVLEVTEPNEPVDALSSFDILAYLVQRDDNFTSSFVQDITPTGTLTAVEHPNNNRRGGFHFLNQKAGKLMFMDISMSSPGAPGSACIRLAGTSSIAGLELLDYNAIGYNTNQIIASNMDGNFETISNEGAGGTAVCRAHFTEQNINLNADTNYTILFKENGVSSQNSFLMRTEPGDTNSLTKPNVLNLSNDTLWDNSFDGHEAVFEVFVFQEPTDTNVTTADLNIDFHDDGNVSMPFSSGFYRYTNAGRNAGFFPFEIFAGSVAGVDNISSSGTIWVLKKLSSFLTFTPIDNIASHSFGVLDNNVTINVTDEDETIEWQVDSNSNFSEDVQYVIRNSEVDERQYFIYTSANGVNYAFDDTLTFGSSNDNPIQKIWNETAERYDYSFIDTLTQNETKYYRLTYKLPYRHYFSIANSDEWQISNVPNVIDLNEIDYDEYTVSNFTDIRNVFIEPIPEISGDEEKAFEMQFTAWSDVNGSLICAGETIFDTDTVNCASLETSPKTFSFTITETDFDSQILIENENNVGSARIFIYDYSIVPRGYFTKRLEALKVNFDVLDSILISALSKQYIQEGNPFRMTTQAYDREGLLDRLELEAYFGSIDTNNLVKKISHFPFELDDDQEDKEETVVTFNELFDGIIDLNGTAEIPDPPRTLILKARLFDVNGFEVAVQSENISFLQYPYFPDDIQINFIPTEKRKGKHPTGLLQLKLNRPDALTGLDLRIWNDANSVTSPNYKDRIYKNIDFSCSSNDCSFEIKVNDFLYEDVNLNTIQITTMLNTEYFSLTNRRTHTLRNIFITPIQFDLAKIHQVVERPDDTYRNDEEIRLVLGVKDSEATDLSDQLDIYATVLNCDSNTGSPNCIEQSTKWNPTGILYDDQFNVTYYFFRHLYTLDDGSLLPDGNFVSFNSYIFDQTGARADIVPILASKCKDNDFLAEFADAVVVGIASLFGFDIDLGTSNYCATSQEPIVTTTTNTAQREYLSIDVGHGLSSPTLEAFYCLSPDTNNITNRPFEQDFLCFTAYTVAEKPTDDFRVRITNSNSDLKEEGSTQQYLEFNIPEEAIAYNDVALLREELVTGNDTEINTVGEFIYEGFRTFAGNLIFNVYGIKNYTDFQSKSGLIRNVGGDLNFDQAFSPSSFTGAYWSKIKGMPVLNIRQFENDGRLVNFESIDRSNFLNHLAENEISWAGQGEQTQMQVVINSFTNPIVLNSEGTLIIDELPSEQIINRANVEEGTSVPSDFIPAVLTFNLQTTMFYNNFSESSTLSGLINVTTIIKQGFVNAILGFIESFQEDPGQALSGFIFGAIILLSIILGIMYVWSKIHANFKEGGAGGVS